MRVLHTADWHLGRTLHGESLEAATEQFFDWLVQTVRYENVDLVLVAGDIYDRGVPPLWAVRSLSNVLNRLSEYAQVVLIPGNHDSATRLGFGSDLLQDRVRIVANLDLIGCPIEINVGKEKALIYPIPYLDPDLTRYSLGRRDETGSVIPTDRSHVGVMSAALERIEDDLNGRGINISNSSAHPAVLIMAHAFLADGLVSDSERNIEVGGAAIIPSGLFDALTKVDYVALGHLHRPQKIKANKGIEIRYSGSPIALSFSEVGTPKSVVVFEVAEGKIADIRTLSTPIFRQLSLLTSTMKAIEAGEHAAFRDHWISVTITDKSRPEQMVSRLRRFFPFLLAASHHPPEDKKYSGPALVTREVDPQQIISQFFTENSGRELTNIEREIVGNILTEVYRGEEQ